MFQTGAAALARLKGRPLFFTVNTFVVQLNGRNYLKGVVNVDSGPLPSKNTYIGLIGRTILPRPEVVPPIR